MRLLVEAARMIGEAFWFGAATRRIFLPWLIAFGVIAVVVLVVVQMVVPVVLYPLV